ncbi:hypothetical protein K1719_036127 [Acacia pycnantha]|nr:hypothetical protein K1719_036127 [Acacia pycnantha]
MSTQFPSFYLMAVPNSQVFLSHNVLVTPEDPQDRGDERRRPASSPPLKIIIPTSSFEDRHDDEEGLKTPTSSIHRISEMLHCPPAPRKPKSLPSKKRRASRPLLLLDLSAEVDSWFPTPFVVDVGGQIKKFKK